MLSSKQASLSGLLGQRSSKEISPRQWTFLTEYTLNCQTFVTVNLGPTGTVLFINIHYEVITSRNKRCDNCHGIFDHRRKVKAKKTLKFSGNSQDKRAGEEVNRLPIKGNEISKQDITGPRLCIALRFKIIKRYVTWLVIVITKLTYL